MPYKLHSQTGFFQGPRDALEDMVVYDEAVDLEPIDFEHFIDEPDLDRPNMEKMFRKHRA